MPLFNSLCSSRSAASAVAGEAASRPSVRPLYEVAEGPDAWSVTAHLPGVAKNELTITDEDGVLAIRADRSWKQPSGWTSLYQESNDLPFELALQHEGAIDADKAQAELKDGVLRLTLPKAEARKPRKIAVG